MSKATIFTDLCERNALRRSSGLPLLDMRTEMARALKREAWAAYQQERERHQPVFERIKREVLVELQEQHGPSFGGSLSGQRAVRMLAEKRFTAYLADLGIAPADVPGEPVMYGESEI